ncbi:hypothetical protein V1517DRAFT_79450 [Lipomyces orientalis]|uniref:Uncharacterized protein n=1 Tax=Lipomyces orientalis TaxID=1233043 RepID=A0ACC3TFX8_9ASCO
MLLEAGETVQIESKHSASEFQPVACPCVCLTVALVRLRRVNPSDHRVRMAMLEIKAARMFDQETIASKYDGMSPFQVAVREYVELFTVVCCKLSNNSLASTLSSITRRKHSNLTDIAVIQLILSQPGCCNYVPRQMGSP